MLEASFRHPTELDLRKTTRAWVAFAVVHREELLGMGLNPEQRADITASFSADAAPDIHQVIDIGRIPGPDTYTPRESEAHTLVRTLYHSLKRIYDDDEALALAEAAVVHGARPFFVQVGEGIMKNSPFK
jgi:hypothetical protein